jgi:creatinine amidohydrolase
MTGVPAEGKPTILWAEMSRPEIAHAATTDTLVIVPVGAIEQHGPHLPVNVDVVDAFEISKLVARRERNVLVAPPVWWGYSPYHARMPGTISLRPETYLGLLQDILDGIISHGFRKIFLLNGHGGNRSLISVAVFECMRRTNVSVASASYWDLATEQIAVIRESSRGGMAHACELETSLQLVFQPALVRMELATRELVDSRKSYGTSYSFRDLMDFGAVTTGYDIATTDPTGILGDPTLASAEKGARILEAVLDGISKFIKEYRG